MVSEFVADWGDGGVEAGVNKKQFACHFHDRQFLNPERQFQVFFLVIDRFTNFACFKTVLELTDFFFWHRLFLLKHMLQNFNLSKYLRPSLRIPQIG